MYLRWWLVEQIVNILGKGFFKVCVCVCVCGRGRVCACLGEGGCVCSLVYTNIHNVQFIGINYIACCSHSASHLYLSVTLLTSTFSIFFALSYILSCSTCPYFHYLFFFFLYYAQDDFPIIGSHLVRLYYVLMGAKIGNNVKIHKDARLGQADLLTIGRCVCVCVCVRVCEWVSVWVSECECVCV